MSKFQGKFGIVSTDLRIILSNFFATEKTADLVEVATPNYTLYFYLPELVMGRTNGRTDMGRCLKTALLVRDAFPELDS